MKHLTTVQIETEPKEAETVEGVPPGLPDQELLCAYLAAFLPDQTRRDGLIGWRVTAVIA